MGRPKLVVRTIGKNIQLPEDIVARMELELFSPLEGRIPFGAQQALISRLLREYFEKLDKERGR